MDELIGRLEKATGHDDVLNFDIALSQGWKPHQAILDGEAFTAKWTTPSGDTRIICPWFTTSINAALTLVPEGWDWCISSESQGGLRHVTLSGPVQFGNVCDMRSADHVSPAIGLCIASLKARNDKHKM